MVENGRVDVSNLQAGINFLRFKTKENQFQNYRIASWKQINDKMVELIKKTFELEGLIMPL
ncbi:MAG: hypothetical protein ACK6BZ_06615 [Candidatus Kapaibacterium sp.]